MFAQGIAGYRGRVVSGGIVAALLVVAPQGIVCGGEGELLVDASAAQVPPPTASRDLPEPAAAQGFLWNISSRPFQYRIRRVHGAC